MAIKKESTPGGKVVLRDTKTGNLAGSIGEGKKQTPKAAVKKALTPKMNTKDAVDSIAVAKRKFEATKEPAQKASFMDFKTLPELISYIAQGSKNLEKSTRSRGGYLGIVWDEEGISRFLHDPTYPRNMANIMSATDPDFQYQNNPEFLKNSSVPKEALMLLGYRHELSQPYPSFMYGSLRPGEYNFKRMLHKAGVESVSTDYKIKGITLYGSFRAQYPFACETPEDNDSFICGDLISFSTKSLGYKTRAKLDSMEGFSFQDPEQCYYKRVLKSVTLEDGTDSKVWVYVSAKTFGSEVEAIKSGDWLSYQGAHLNLTTPEQRALDLDSSTWK